MLLVTVFLLSANTDRQFFRLVLEQGDIALRFYPSIDEGPAPDDTYASNVELLDIDSGDEDFEKVIAQRRRLYPGVPLLLLTDQINEIVLLRAIHLGVQAIVLREEGAPQLIVAIRALAAGGSHLGSGLLRTLFDNLAGKAVRLSAMGLTPRQLEIAECLMKGHSYKEVARMNYISIDTLNSHVRSIYAKLGVRSAVELISRFG